MTQEWAFYRRDAKTESDKLGFLAHTCALMNDLIQQKFDCAAVSKNRQYFYTNLRKLAVACYRGSKENPADFATTFFLMNNPVLLPQERIMYIDRNLAHFMVARSVLQFLINHDNVLAPQDKAFITQEHKEKIDPFEGVLFGDVVDLEEDLSVSTKKESLVYNHENVASALKKAKACCVIFGGEINATLSSPTLLKKPSYMKRLSYQKSFEESLKGMLVYSGRKISGWSMELQEYMEQSYALMRAVQPDPSLPKRNIHLMQQK